MSSDIEVIVRIDNSDRVNFLKLPLKKRASAYRAKKETLLKRIFQGGNFKSYRVVLGWYRAPSAVRGVIDKKNLNALKKIKGISNVHLLPKPADRIPAERKSLSNAVYWGLIQVKETTVGVKGSSYFYFTVAVKAVSGKAAEKQIKVIAGEYTSISSDWKFRKVVSKAKVILVEGCETQWGEKRPDHLVMMRTMQNSRNHILIKQLVEQAVPLY
jgi:hypothetical protein